MKKRTEVVGSNNYVSLILMVWNDENLLQPKIHHQAIILPNLKLLVLSSTLVNMFWAIE